MDHVAPRLRTLYALIRARVRPDTKIVVIGYPRLFPLKTHSESFRCRDIILAGIQASEQDAANHLAGVLDGVIGSAASAAGFGYIDSVPLFANHDPCAHDRYLNVFIVAHLDESFHPTAAGHAVWANALATSVG